MGCKPKKKQFGGSANGFGLAETQKRRKKKGDEASAALEKRNAETAKKAKIPFSGRLVPPTGYKKTKK